jgi:hypothetical protein
MQCKASEGGGNTLYAGLPGGRTGAGAGAGAAAAAAAGFHSPALLLMTKGFASTFISNTENKSSFPNKILDTSINIIYYIY